MEAKISEANKIFEKITKDLSSRYKGKIVAIDSDSGSYFIGDSELDAYKKNVHSQGTSDQRFGSLCYFRNTTLLLRKEVIQPHLPVRLPCYDLVPLTDCTFADALLAVRQPTSGTTHSGDLTGGVYKTRERIHPIVSDIGLLTIPASCRRVAACNPNWDRFLRLAPPCGIATLCAGHCSTCVAPGVRAVLT